MAERCFKLSGNFQQNGRWSQPDPGFIGYIIVNDDGKFEGYMDELYSHPSDASSSRFVTGICVENDTKLAFYKLVSSYQLAPLLYVFTNVSEYGKWVIFDGNNVLLGGKASVKLDVSEVSPEVLSKLCVTKEEVLLGPGWNEKLASSISELIEVFDVDI